MTRFVPPGSGSNNPAPSDFRRWTSGSSYPDGSASLSNPTGPYSSGYASNAASGYADSEYSNAGLGSVGDAVYYSAAESTDGPDGATESEFTSESSVEEVPEPVFSDVSDLEPVYFYRSRSSYQHGRSSFAQTRYTPGEVLYPPAPVIQNSPEEPGMTSSKGKGGF